MATTNPNAAAGGAIGSLAGGILGTVFGYGAGGGAGSAIGGEAGNAIGGLFKKKAPPPPPWYVRYAPLLVIGGLAGVGAVIYLAVKVKPS